MRRDFEPVGCEVDLSTGAMSNATGSYQKRFGDLDGLYADAAAFDAMRGEWDERIVYDVSELRPTDSRAIWYSASPACRPARSATNIS